MVIMVVFTTMALGLNIVVGYAGLLDLGYVAFYAVGAYTAGWLASSSTITSRQGRGSGRGGLACPGSTSRCGLCSPRPAFCPRFAGIPIGLPTLRLRGDYLAIVTLAFGEIVPQFVRNADNLDVFALNDGTSGSPPSTRSRPVRSGPGWAARKVRRDSDRPTVLLDCGRDPR